MPERRKKQQLGHGPERRGVPHNYTERREEFALFREKVILVVAVGGLTLLTFGSLGFVAAGIDISGATPELSGLGIVFAGLLGLPKVLKTDEKAAQLREGENGA